MTNPASSALKAFRELPKAIPAFLLLLMPKCSLCLAAYLNLFSIAGISLGRFHAWALPALFVLIAMNIVTGWIKARKLNNYRAFVLLLTGVILLATGKMLTMFPLISWAGIGLILVSNVLQILQSDKVCDRNLAGLKNKLKSKTHFFVNYF